VKTTSGSASVHKCGGLPEYNGTEKRIDPGILLGLPPRAEDTDIMMKWLDIYWQAANITATVSWEELGPPEASGRLSATSSANDK
jgi:hypothetical protein